MILNNEQLVELWSAAIVTAAAEGANDVIVFGNLVETVVKEEVRLRLNEVLKVLVPDVEE